MRYGKADVIFLAGHSSVVTRMSNGIHAVCQTDIDNTLMNVSNLTGIFALDAALAEVVSSVIVANALYVCFDREVLNIISLNRKNTDNDLITYGIAVVSIAYPIPREISRHNGAFHTECLNANRLFGNCNNTRLDNATIINFIC